VRDAARAPDEAAAPAETQDRLLFVRALLPMLSAMKSMRRDLCDTFASRRTTRAQCSGSDAAHIAVGRNHRSRSSASSRIGVRASALVLAIVAALAVVACGHKPTSSGVGKGVLVIAIDSLRADHTGFSGYDRDTTPVLDALAAQGVTFTQMFTTSPELLSAHASLLTGCDPTIVRRAPFADPESAWLVSDCYIPEDVPHVAREFLAHGYLTAAFFDHPGLSSFYGFGAGFQEFRGYRSEDKPPSELGFQDVATKLFNWLRDVDTSKDWFAYVHVNDLERIWKHNDPRWDTYYAPRPELSTVPPVSEEDRAFFAVPRSRWSGGTLSIGEYEARYDGELRCLDSKLGRFFEGLRVKGRFAYTSIVIVGTYGLGFGDSGLYLDSGTLSDADLHVPMIIRPAPALEFRTGTKVEHLASTMDVAPTLLDLSGIPPPRGMHGVSHLGALRGDPRSAREYTFASGGLQSGFAVIDSRYCYEHSSPGTIQAPPSPGGDKDLRSLALSWYGDALDHSTQYRTFLHDRAKNSATGHLVGSASDGKAVARLAEAGSDWFTWMLHARDAMQRTVSETAMEPEVLAELHKRGLIPDTR
jgi:arylsulfatase A-like enzyme